MIVKLLTEHHLEFLSLKGGCRGGSVSTLVKLLEISCQGSIIPRLAETRYGSPHDLSLWFATRSYSNMPSQLATETT